MGEIYLMACMSLCGRNGGVFFFFFWGGGGAVRGGLRGGVIFSIRLVQFFYFYFFLLLINIVNCNYYMSLVLRKPVYRVSDQSRHKPVCTATEDGQWLEIRI